MKFFLHIKISEELPDFDFRKKNWFSDLNNGISSFDLDNHSDLLTVETAIKAIESADCIFVMIESEECSPGSILKLIKRLASFEKDRPLQIVHNGSNALLERLEKGFNHTWKKNFHDGELKTTLNAFFNTEY